MRYSPDILNKQPEASIQGVLEWLARNHGHISQDQTEQLFKNIRLVRAAPMPTPQRGKLLDLFYAHTEQVIKAELPDLHQITLPVSRRLRHRIRIMQDLLESLAQDYLNTLSEIFDPLSDKPHKSPEETLYKVMQCIAWNIQISHLAAAPTPMGLWLELHSSMQTARQLDLSCDRLEPLYLRTLLAAIAQPASFNSRELNFIAQCIESLADCVSLSKEPPTESDGTFWIDPTSDFPAHAIVRRAAPLDTPIWFFSGKALAEKINKHLTALNKGLSAADLKLPGMASTTGGKSILHRLSVLWGDPSKRRFTRRRQSYRANICIGLEQLWPLLHANEPHPSSSQWMVINESPDGYSVMHVAGQVGHLLVGDILAIQPQREPANPLLPWHVCIVRWAISENPEHIELGLQLLSSHAISAVIIQPKLGATQQLHGLLIPESPPVRPSAAVIVESGQLNIDSGKLLLMLEKDNLEIREVHPTHLEEHSKRIEVFSVEPDETA